MSTICPHCQKNLKFPPAAQAKIAAALKKLPADKKLPLKCPFCKKTLELNKDGSSTVAQSRAQIQEASKAVKKSKADQVAASVVIKPPEPPALDWLRDEDTEQEEQAEGIPMAMVLHPNPPVREQIKATMSGLGYQCVSPDSAQAAIEQMQFVNFANVTLHEKFDGSNLKENEFHNFMREMSMERRRDIFYTLIGAGFRTLYDLEALAASANLVVNDKDLAHLEVALLKAIPDYEKLFGPLVEALEAYGKR